MKTRYPFKTSKSHKAFVISQNVFGAVVMFACKKEILILLFVLVIVVVAFLPSLFNGFVNFDDELLVVNNPGIRSLDWNGIKTIFTSTASDGYIPVSIFSFAVEYHFFGLNPFVYHLDNLFLHLLVTALIFFFGLRLKLDVWACGLAALLFGIHPMHVESVAWISERKDVLYAVFYLLALHSHWSYLETGRKRSYAATSFYGLLSMLAKPMALSLPLILLLLDWKKERKLTLNVFLEKIPHLLYIFPIALITYNLHAEASHTPLLESALTFIWSATFYIWKFLFPFVLLPIYVRPEPVSLLNPVYSASIILLILCILIFIRFRSDRWMVFAWLFYLCSVFFLFRLDTSQINVVADRYMYLPSIGFCFVFGVFIHRMVISFQEKRDWRAAIVVICAAVLLGALSLKTFLQCRAWNNSIALWSTMINQTSDSWVSFYNRAKAYEAEQRYDFALADYNRALLIDPSVAVIYNNRANILSRLGREKEALEDLNKTIELNPGMILAYNNRGLIYTRMNRYDLAVEDFNQVARLDPLRSEVYYLRSMSYIELNRLDDAMRDAEKAKALGYLNMDVYIDKLEKYTALHQTSSH